MGRTYAHIFRYVSCDIGHNKTNRRTIQITDGQLDAINPPYHLPNIRLRAISAPRNGEFSSALSGAIAPIRQAQPPLDLTHVFWEAMNRRPPRLLIQPLGIEGNAMVTLNVYVDIEPMSKIQNMPLVSPALRGKSSRRSRWYLYC